MRYRSRSFPELSLQAGLLLSFCLAVLAFPVWSASTSTPASDILAQDFENGLSAASQGNWDLAAGYFEKNVQESPGIAQGYLNLGLAYRNAGSLFLAIPWLEAYLEASGDTPERKNIEAQVERLSSQAQKKAGELLALASGYISRIPDDYWEDRQAALEREAFLQALAGRIPEALRISRQSARPSSQSFYIRKYGELMASAHDYELVQTLLKSIDDPSEADLLRQALCRNQILRAETQEAENTLREIRDSGGRKELLRQLFLSYARSLDVRHAEALLLDAKSAEEKLSLENILLLSYLRAGKIEEAKTLAKQMNSARPSSELKAPQIVLGDGEKVFADLRKWQVSSQDASKKVPEAYLATLTALWMGDRALAQEGCALIRDWIHQSRQVQMSSYSVIACGYVDAETGNIDKTLEQIKTLEPRVQTDFALSLFWRLVWQKRFEDIQRLIIALSRRPTTQGILLKELVPALSNEGELTQALVTAQIAANFAFENRLGFVLRSLADWAGAQGLQEFAQDLNRHERIAHWVSLAGSLKAQESIAHLDQFLARNSSEDLRSTVSALHQASGDWISALAYIRGIKKRHQLK